MSYFNKIRFKINTSTRLYEGLGIVAIEAQAMNIKTIISNTVPTAAKVTEQVEFLGIADSKVWVKHIKNYVRQQNKKNYIEENKFPKEYDIKYAAKNLEKIYLNLYNEIS